MSDDRWKDITYNIPSLLPLQPPPQTQEQVVPYIQALHNYLADDRQKIARAINVISYFRNLLGDEADRPEAMGTHALYTEVDTGEMFYDSDVPTGSAAWNRIVAASRGELVELDTTKFNAILSAADDNVQDAMDTIDDHTHSSFTDLDLSGALTVDTINEHTLMAGVTVDGVLLRDYNATVNYLTANLGAYIDHIYEKTASHGVYVDGLTIKDSSLVDPINADFSGTLSVDTISEHTAGNGVYIDGARIKDTGASFYAQVNAAGVNVNPAEPYVDLQSNGVGNYWRVYTPNSANGSFRVMDMNALQDCFIVEDAVGANALVVGATYLSTTKALQVDHIYEKTAAHGVDIDGVLLKDDNISSLIDLDMTGDITATGDVHALGSSSGDCYLDLNKGGAYLADIAFNSDGTEQWRIRHNSAEEFLIYDSVNGKTRINITQDGDLLLELPSGGEFVAITNQWGGYVSKFAQAYCNLQINTSAPADADMGNKTFTLYNSGTTIYLKHKDYAGTCRTGTVCTVA